MGYVLVGIDVSKDHLDTAIASEDTRDTSLTVENTRAGHRRLLTRLNRHRQPVRVCIESTGVYGLDVARTLANEPNIEVMIVNPRRARRFADALGRRAKTDPIDAHTLLEYCRRMTFVAWRPPSDVALSLRALARRMATTSDQLVEEKNRLHAAEACRDLRVIRTEIKRTIRYLEKSIARLEASAVKLVQREPDLRTDFRLLVTVKGIATRSAIKILGEFATMPEGLTAKQLTAFAGLDPKIFTSGSSVSHKPRISKRGNRFLRKALFMPAATAAQTEPALRDYHDRLIGRGKTPMQARVAVMRKLLLMLHAIRRDKKPCQRIA